MRQLCIISKFKDTESRQRLSGARRGENGELLFNEYRVLVWDNKEVLEIESGNVLNTTLKNS